MSKIIERASDAVTLLVGVSIVVLAGVVIGERVLSQPVVSSAAPVAVPNWQAYTKRGHRLGPSDAAVTIIEFGDYQCPACRGWQPQIEAILRKYPEDVAFIYRHWPLDSHQFAYPAARAAECAADQGRFWEFHRELYADGNWLGDAMSRMATRAEVSDIMAFEACIAVTNPVPRIEEDKAAALAVGGPGTPTVIVNGFILRAGRDSLGLEAIVRKAVGL